MPESPYRALRILLRVRSLWAALGGLLLIFGEKPLIVWILLHPPEADVSTLLLSLLKEVGGMVLTLCSFVISQKARRALARSCWSFVASYRGTRWGSAVACATQSRAQRGRRGRPYSRTLHSGPNAASFALEDGHSLDVGSLFFRELLCSFKVELLIHCDCVECVVTVA
jgi:hypothetical protein